MLTTDSGDTDHLFVITSILVILTTCWRPQDHSGDVDHLGSHDVIPAIMTTRGKVFHVIPAIVTTRTIIQTFRQC